MVYNTEEYIIVTEIWKNIKDYEGLYQVSNLGRVKSMDRIITRKDGISQFRKGIIKTPKINSDGYHTVTLSKNGNNKTLGIHILVARHYIPNPENKSEVSHIDFNRKNNRVDNLEWCTHQENIQHSSNNGRYKQRDFNGRNNPNYGNHSLSEFYKNNPNIAKEKLSRPAQQNGRAVKIELYDEEMNYIDTFGWIGACAEYLIDNNFTKANIDSIRSNIIIASNKNKKYLKHFYKKIA